MQFWNKSPSVISTQYIWFISWSKNNWNVMYPFRWKNDVEPAKSFEEIVIGLSAKFDPTKKTHRSVTVNFLWELHLTEIFGGYPAEYGAHFLQLCFTFPTETTHKIRERLGIFLRLLLMLTTRRDLTSYQLLSYYASLLLRRSYEHEYEYELLSEFVFELRPW